MRYRIAGFTLLLLIALSFQITFAGGPRSFEQTTPMPDGSAGPTGINARYIDLVNETLALNQDEIALLQKQNFMVSDRLAFPQFLRAYAWIYWKDLPVIVTTDSILHAMHQTYDDMLLNLESTVLTTRLERMLQTAREHVRTQAGTNTDAALAPYYADLETYLTVPLILLTGDAYAESAAGKTLADTIFNSLNAMYYADAPENPLLSVSLFGTTRDLDVTQFFPRGHYSDTEAGARYFLAMTWLAQADFRLVDYDSDGNPTANAGAIAAAMLLRDALNTTGSRPSLDDINRLLEAFVGHSDNMTLADFERFLTENNLAVPADVFSADKKQLLDALLALDYGLQQINSEFRLVNPDNPDPLPNAISLRLLGQRFAIDSWVMGQLVFDRLRVNDRPVLRSYPSPLDVMYVLGSDQAGVHLQDEFAQYGYQPALDTLRDEVSQTPLDDTLYNRWLGAIGRLDAPSTDANYPTAMQSPAWADKMLQTQLAGWTQLRHDNLLYVKQSYTGQVMCSYPSGYVEPYPEFYHAVADYARFGLELFESLDREGFSGGDMEFYQTTTTYFTRLEDVALRLETMALKELSLKEFNDEENAFIKSIVIRQSVEVIPEGCTSRIEEQWTGWYNELLPWGDDTPALIADVHTNPGGDGLAPAGVLHVATGDPVAMVFIVNTDEGQAAYVGPVYSYYEHITDGIQRLDDDMWMAMLHPNENQTYAYYQDLLKTETDPENRKQYEASAAAYASQLRPLPAPPAWTSTFRLPVTELEAYLVLPNREDE